MKKSIGNKVLVILATAALPLGLVACDYRETTEEQGVATVEEAEGAEAREEMAEEMEMDERAEEAADAAELVQEATMVVEQMKSEPDLQQALGQAKAVLIAPDYGEGAAGVGVRGGEAVVVARTAAGGWSAPAFYDIGAVSLGAQVGAAGGDVAMLIMTDAALENFLADQSFALNAEAGLTLFDFSQRGQETWGEGEDVIFWSDMEGAFAGVALSVSGINFDDEENPAYYGQMVTPGQVLTGQLESDLGDSLTRALPG